MTDLMVIIVSVAVSLVADIGLLINKRVGSADYKNALKLARNSKDIVEQQNIIKDINIKISQLESQLNSFQRNNSDISYLKKEIKALKDELDNYQTSETSSDEAIISAVKELAVHIDELEKRDEDTPTDNSADYKKLESAISKLNGEINSLKSEINNSLSLKDRISAIEVNIKNLNNEIRNINVNNKSSFDSTELERKISTLKSEIDLIKSNVNVSEQNNQSEQLVHQLIDEVSNLKKVVSAQQVVINSLKGASNVTANTSADKSPVVATKPSVFKFVPTNVITPDETYVKKLLSGLLKIKENLGSWEYKSCSDGLKKLLDEGDFEDGEEIMNAVHELIKKYIYGSDTKVSASDWDKLEKYIIDAGYSPVPVKAGDNIYHFRGYFDRPIPANGGTPDTIKQIQLKPFVLTYEDCGEKEELKLCGKCTYYK